LNRICVLVGLSRESLHDGLNLGTMIDFSQFPTKLNWHKQQIDKKTKLVEGMGTAQKFSVLIKCINASNYR
jgi:hypothetical protein